MVDEYTDRDRCEIRTIEPQREEVRALARPILERHLAMLSEHDDTSRATAPKGGRQWLSRAHTLAT